MEKESRENNPMFRRPRTFSVLRRTNKEKNLCGGIKEVTLMETEPAMHARIIELKKSEGIQTQTMQQTSCRDKSQMFEIQRCNYLRQQLSIRKIALEALYCEIGWIIRRNMTRLSDLYYQIHSIYDLIIESQDWMKLHWSSTQRQEFHSRLAIVMNFMSEMDQLQRNPNRTFLDFSNSIHSVMAPITILADMSVILWTAHDPILKRGEL